VAATVNVDLDTAAWFRLYMVEKKEAQKISEEFARLICVSCFAVIDGSPGANQYHYCPVKIQSPSCNVFP
jgi:hypothetical protein